MDAFGIRVLITITVGLYVLAGLVYLLDRGHR